MTYVGATRHHSPTLAGFGDGRMLYAPYGLKKNQTVRTILGFHGHASGVTNTELIPANFEQPLDGYVMAAERGYLCYAGHWGGNATWGNATVMGYVDAALTWLAAEFGPRTDKVYLYAGSMGAAHALNWAKRNPSKVAAIYLAAPAVNLSRIHDENVNGYVEAEINTAYTDAAGWAAAKAQRDPTLFAAELAGIPIRILYSDGDTVIVPSDVTGFRTAVGGSAVELVKAAGDPIHANTLPGFSDVLGFFAAHP